MVFSRRTTLASPRMIQKKKKIFYVRVTITLVAIVLLCTGIVVGSRMKQLQVSAVKIEGLQVLTDAQIRSSVMSISDQNYLWIFPKTNILWYPSGAISKKIREDWSRVKEVSLDRNDLNSITITITEKTPKYIWCGDSKQDFISHENQKCFFLDESGSLFSESPYFSGDVYFKMYGRLGDIHATTTPVGTKPIGQEFLTSDIRNFIFDFAAMLTDIHMTPVRFFARTPNEYEMMLRDGSFVFFNNRSAIDYTKVALQKLLSQNSFTVDIPDSPHRLDYVDVRFTNKVYYKLKEPGI